jgi:phosphatidylserine/phosphatidylglycerophosphate/cardiolipin synthase-like enzyme
MQGIRKMRINKGIVVLSVIFLTIWPKFIYSADDNILPAKEVFSTDEDLNHTLSQHIELAQESIKGCFYSIKSEEVASALIKAHLEGIKVQIVIDEGRLFLEGSLYPKLKNFGLVKEDTITSGLMHHKFCVIDDRLVWTGSYNPTPYAKYENNDAVVIQSEEIADIYTREFEKLWGNDTKSRKKESCEKIPLNENTTVEVYFSPEDGVFALERMLEVLEKAEKSIYFAQFTITHPDVALALIKKTNKEVEVKGIMEYEQVGPYSKYPWFELFKINVQQDRNYFFAFHHKFFIVDEHTVITGSLNPTKAGFKSNRENLLIIHSSEIAKEYSEYFRSISK